MGGATFGAKLFTATFSVTGVFSPVATGAWIAIWTPYTAGNGQVNPAASVATPAAIAPAAITAATKKVGKVKTRVTGTVTQAGQPLAGQRVELWAGLKRNQLKRVKAVKTNAKGAYAVVVREEGAVLPHAGRRRRAPGAAALRRADDAPCPVREPDGERVRGDQPDQAPLTAARGAREGVHTGALSLSSAP